MWSIKSTLFYLCVFTISSLSFFQLVLAQDLGGLKSDIESANQKLKSGKMIESVKLAEDASKTIPQLIRTVPNKDLSELKKLHGQLMKLRESLEIEGAEFSVLEGWESLLKERKSPQVPPSKTNPEVVPGSEKKSTEIVFTKDIAPWLVEQCSRCHITADRGGFSMTSFSALMKGSKAGAVIIPNEPESSRIVECIETGDMPRGGGKVAPENIKKLKLWIQQGAKLDGAAEAATLPIVQLVRSSLLPTSKTPSKREVLPGGAPTGKETVSFGRDIAPILTQNCNGCHYNGQRPFGGLRFETFAGLAKGGDSGSIIEPNRPDESLLVKKLLGTAGGTRMPMGRPPLADDKMKLITTWIKEGATFDGKSKDTRLDRVIDESWADRASHQALFEKRMKVARDNWKLIAPNREPSLANDDEIFVVGDIGDENAKLLLDQAKAAIGHVRKIFKLSGKEPVIKGGFVVFALKQRYDYSEFGNMLESRSIPSEWSSHWRAGALDGYIAMIYDRSEGKINESSLVQQMVSLWIGSFERVPRWFADGAGRYALASHVGQNDARVQLWQKRLPENLAQLKNLKPFLDGSMNDDDSATIGYGIIKWMHDSKMKNQYEGIVRALHQGKSFDQATAANVGDVEVFLQRVLGKKK